MTFTDNGTKVPHDWMPLAYANGVEWASQRRGMADRFNCLYRSGKTNKALWYLGAISTVIYRPQWLQP